jgi:hypothetical protein
MLTAAAPRPWICLLLAAGLGWLLALPARADGPDPKKLNDKVKEIAGSAEFLRDVPKHFATLQAVDPARRLVTLKIEGDVLAKVWPLAPDAEVKIKGWWGRLGQFTPGDRVWAWLKTDRKKQPVAVSMLADEITEQDIHGAGLTVEAWDGKQLRVKPAKGNGRSLDATKATVRLGTTGQDGLQSGQKVYVQSAGKQARLILSPAAFEEVRRAQQTDLRGLWTKEGLPGSVAFVHVFSGEMDLVLDHEAMRWARSLQTGDKVTLAAAPPIKAVVKQVQPWRERTQLRLVVYSFDLADLSPGQRVHLLRTPPPSEVDSAVLPPDVDRSRGRDERIDWFLANIYCTCQIAGDRCTGHFYTLASCNPNGCAMPNNMRRVLAAKIDAGKTDRQIFEELLKVHGRQLVRPHLLP